MTTPGSTIRARLYAALDWLKHAGVSLDGLERALDYWRQVGLLRALAIVILVLTPIVKLVWLPWMGSRFVELVADTYGLDVEVGDWTGSLWKLEATAENVVLKSRGRHTRDALARADAVTIDLSLLRCLKGCIKSVIVDEPTLHLERGLSGRWNWEDLADVRAGSRSVSIETLRLDGLRIEWIEHVPGNSGGGVVNSSRATLYVDDARVMLQDVVLPTDSRGQTTRFSVDGRTADGVLSLSGTANFLKFVGEKRPARHVSAQSSASMWAPAVAATVYLENIGAAAVGQMLSRGPLLAAGGSMSGKVEFTLADDRLTCRGDLMLKDVPYVPNAGSTLLAGHTDVLRTELAGFRATRQVSVDCGNADDGASYRPLHAIQASVTRQAVRDAAPAVQQAAIIDERHATGQLSDAELKSIGDRVARTAGRALTSRLVPAGQADVLNSLAGQGTSGENGDAIARGVRSVGRGIKRLFTREKKVP